MDNQNNHSSTYVQKQREKKHKQIMGAIYNYKRTMDQVKMLDKVRQATCMEIQLRFKNCSHNLLYKFPLTEYNSDNQEDSTQLGSLTGALYDLHAQTSIIQKSVSTKTLSLDASRRVKSLEKQHVADEDQIINKIRRRNLQYRQSPTLDAYPIRKNSLRDRLPRDRSLLKLPQLKKRENDKKNNLEEIVGKKIHTETSSPDSKKLAKYLKGAENNSKQGLKGQPKKFFLQEC